MSCFGSATIREPASAIARERWSTSQGASGCFVNAIVLAEFAWTLTRVYKLPRVDVAHRASILSWNRPEFVVASCDEAMRAVRKFRTGPADFADYFLAEINSSAGCAATATFDRAALKSGAPFQSVPMHA